MPHRTGSKPIGQIIWNEFGGKEGAPPPQLSVLFKRTRQDRFGNVSTEVAEKLDEIITVEEENDSLTSYMVLERCFGEQKKGHIVGFGAGLRPKHLRGPLPSRDDLNEHLEQLERENSSLRSRLEALEEERANDRAEHEQEREEREREKEQERLKHEREKEQQRVEREREKERHEELERKVNMLMGTFG